MRSTEYEKRKKAQPGQIKCTSRYVTNRLYPHRRKVKIPLNKEPDDDPATRGLTQDT